jgi:hypothetical protein
VRRRSCAGDAESGDTTAQVATSEWLSRASPGNATDPVTPASRPQMIHRGGVLETANRYGLHCYTKEQFANFALWLE